MSSPRSTSQTVSHSSASYGSNQVFNNSGTVNITQTAPHDEKLLDEIFDAPDLLSPHFTGRKAELEDIQNAFDKTTGNIPSRYALYGMPGLGKTQLVLKYAVSAFQGKQVSYVFWVSASSLEKIHQGFSKILDLVCYPGRMTMDQDAKMTAARLWLEDGIHAGRKWLLVIDNVQEETAAVVRDSLPRKNHHGKVLMTTRTKAIAEGLATVSGIKHKVLSLQQPSTEDAINLLLKSIEEDLAADVSAQAKSIVQSVGCLPLAVDQAASFMKQSGCSAIELLNFYKTEQAEKMMDWKNDLSRYEEQSVTATFALAFDQLAETSSTTSDLLRVLSFLDPESIPVNMLVEGSVGFPNTSAKARSEPKSEPRRRKQPFRRLGEILKGRSKLSSEHLDQQNPRSSPEIFQDEQIKLITLLQSPIDLQTAIQQLQKLSFVVSKVTDGVQTLWIHDLVHLLLRTKLMSASERSIWLDQAIWIVFRAMRQIEEPQAPETWPRYEKFVSHAQELSKNAEQHEVYSPELSLTNAWLAHYFSECGRFGESENLHRHIVDQRLAKLGPSHIDTLSSMANLANIYRLRGRFDMAEQLGSQALQGLQSSVGSENPATIASMINLAKVYKVKNRLEEAEEMLDSSLQISKRVFGPEHHLTLVILGTLARIYIDRKMWDRAQDLCHQTLEARKRAVGPEHSETLTSMSNLAIVLFKKGNLTEAEVLMDQVVRTLQKNFGLDHPETLTAMCNLAFAWKGLGRSEDATILLKTTCESREKTLGANHPATLTCKEALRSWEEDG